MYKLLIAEDEILERQALKMIISAKIKEIGLIIEAENGRKAIQLADQHTPDIILMDIKMPGIDGIGAVKAIKKHHSDTKIIMLSAFNTFEYARQVMQQGVKEYLVKPARKDELIAAIERVLSEIQKERREKQEQANLREIVQWAISPEENDGQLMSDDKKLRRARAFMEENYAQAISLEDAAEHVGLSPFYLSKLFKEHFSVNFIDYLTQLRVEKAKALMLNPTHSLKEICFNVGYKDPNYFSRVFKKSTGLSPSEYRRQVQLRKKE
ncbi:response regulator [Neobacillus notoginsengisoli]|uniref:Response regulator n=1 Tax=Neobacillus notoginsengisoli TaxID=1578198 RepID=A0A417YZB9_9BACI|nr:response regulator [Neobacillus notoginsengisoli]RHW42857.1 response regulator [Neobacillus notoginsengisoli]